MDMDKPSLPFPPHHGCTQPLQPVPPPRARVRETIADCLLIDADEEAVEESGAPAGGSSSNASAATSHQDK